jgi:hypothetical protein
MAKKTIWTIALALALPACGGGTETAANNTAAAPDAVPTQAELDRDAALAGEAAEDEAADMNDFGGDAVNMDRANGF